MNKYNIDIHYQSPDAWKHLVIPACSTQRDMLSNIRATKH